jgi:hypothetical protein
MFDGSLFESIAKMNEFQLIVAVVIIYIIVRGYVDSVAARQKSKTAPHYYDYKKHVYTIKHKHELKDVDEIESTGNSNNP